jgi:hypothetical protein
VKVKLHCARCSCEFTPRASTGRPPRYCSSICSRAVQVERQRAVRASRSLRVSLLSEIAGLEQALASGMTHQLAPPESPELFESIAGRLAQARAELRVISMRCSRHQRRTSSRKLADNERTANHR